MLKDAVLGNDVLVYNQRMYNDGCCPLCGHKEKNTGTIVATKETAYRYHIIKKRPWWKFWLSDEFTKVYRP